MKLLLPQVVWRRPRGVLVLANNTNRGQVVGRGTPGWPHYMNPATHGAKGVRAASRNWFGWGIWGNALSCRVVLRKRP